MLSDEEIAGLDEDERGDLVRRLALLAPAPSQAGRPMVVPFLVGITISCLALIPWMVLLALKLPPDYTTRRWIWTWVGFDAALWFCLAQTAWNAWKRRQLVAMWAVVTATLLIGDAWFDIMTADVGRDLVVAVASAAVAELPMAALLLWWARRIITLTIRYSRSAVGRPADERIRLSRLPLFGLAYPKAAPPPGPAAPVEEQRVGQDGSP